MELKVLSDTGDVVTWVSLLPQSYLVSPPTASLNIAYYVSAKLLKQIGLYSEEWRLDSLKIIPGIFRADKFVSIDSLTFYKKWTWNIEATNSGVIEIVIGSE